MDGSPPDLAELERALGLAHRAIGRREYTVAQMRELLERRGLSQGTIDAAVVELAGAGLLDDARFARRFAGDKRELEQWGGRRIASELGRKGVSEDEIAAVVGAHGQRDELDSARLLLERRLPEAPSDDRGATGPGGSWSGAGTSPSSPTRRSGSTSARPARQRTSTERGGARGGGARVRQLGLPPPRRGVTLMLSGRHGRRETGTTCKSQLSNRHDRRVGARDD